MHRVVIVAEVEDTAKWEEGFRTHGDLFKSQTVATCRYATTGDHEVTVCFEVDDLETYFRILESAATEEAMAFDGIRRETVKISVLDKQFTP
jgi:hypothetical protein